VIYLNGALLYCPKGTDRGSYIAFSKVQSHVEEMQSYTRVVSTVCSQSFFLAASDPKDFIVPRFSPLDPMMDAPLVELSKPCNIYSPLSRYEAENGYTSAVTRGDAAFMIGETEEDMRPERTAPGDAWTNVRSGFWAENSC
jgi:hypothetical protein